MCQSRCVFVCVVECLCVEGCLCVCLPFVCVSWGVVVLDGTVVVAVVL